MTDTPHEDIIQPGPFALAVEKSVQRVETAIEYLIGQLPESILSEDVEAVRHALFRQASVIYAHLANAVADHASHDGQDLHSLVSDVQTHGHSVAMVLAAKVPRKLCTHHAAAEEQRAAKSAPASGS